MPETVLVLRADGSVALSGSVADVKARRVRDATLAYIVEHPGLAQNEIKDGLGMRWQDARSALTALVKDGGLTVIGTGKRGDAGRYFAAKGGSRPNGAENGVCGFRLM